MPSSVTHNYFAKDVYDKLDVSIQNTFQKDLGLYGVFAQGPDPYFFYDFHLTKKSKEIYKINRKMHSANINEHFRCLVNYINEKNYYSNSEVIAYLYGQICHFVLDTTLHPFVIYNSGVYDKKRKNTYKYNGRHEEMEYYFDIYLIYKKENILPKKYKVYDKIFDIKAFSYELNNTIDLVTSRVYGFDNVSAIYYKAICDMKKFYHVFNYDRIGIKKSIYSIMDFVCGNRLVKKKELSFYVNPLSKEHLLNSGNNTWNHPCDINEKYNYSFTDLYIKATCKAIKIIIEIDNMLKEKKIDNKKIDDLFGNLNYATGKDCNLKVEFKYFKF